MLASASPLPIADAGLAVDAQVVVAEAPASGKKAKSRRTLFSRKGKNSHGKSTKAGAKKNRLPPSMLVKQGTSSGLPPRPANFVKQPTLSAILGKIDAKIEASRQAGEEVDPVFDHIFAGGNQRFVTPEPDDGRQKIQERPSTPRYVPLTTCRDVPASATKKGVAPLLRGSSRLKNVAQPTPSSTSGRPSTPRFLASAGKKRAAGTTSPKLCRVQALGGSGVSIGKNLLQHKQLSFFVLNSFDSPSNTYDSTGTPTSPMPAQNATSLIDLSNDEESWNLVEGLMDQRTGVTGAETPLTADTSLPNTSPTQPQTPLSVYAQAPRRPSPTMATPVRPSSPGLEDFLTLSVCKNARARSCSPLDSPLRAPVDTPVRHASPGLEDFLTLSVCKNARARSCSPLDSPTASPNLKVTKTTPEQPPQPQQQHSNFAPNLKVTKRVPQADVISLAVSPARKANGAETATDVEQLFEVYSPPSSPAATAHVYGFGDVVLRKSVTPPGAVSSKARRPRSAGRNRPRSAGGIRPRSANRRSPLASVGTTQQGSISLASDVVLNETATRGTSPKATKQQQVPSNTVVNKHTTSLSPDSIQNSAKPPAQISVRTEIKAPTAAINHTLQQQPTAAKPPLAPATNKFNTTYTAKSKGGKSLPTLPLANKSNAKPSIKVHVANSPRAGNKKLALRVLNTNQSANIQSPIKTSAGDKTLASPSPKNDKADRRAIEAAAWTDKEIRKLIAEIQKRGAANGDGKHEITFGQLFEETANIFEALSGTCKTAKKYKVVGYDAEQLWQGQNDATVVTLLKTTHDGIKIRPRRSMKNKRTANAKSKGFGRGSMSFQNAKCHACTKTVYPMEFVGASDKAFHKACFRCNTCSSTLSKNDYCVSADGMFRCGAHHREFELGMCTGVQVRQQSCVQVR